MDRYQEDGDGLEVLVLEAGVVRTKPLPSNKIPGRRDSMDIAFWCEFCKTIPILTISQHKGRTFVEWTESVPSEFTALARTQHHEDGDDPVKVATEVLNAILLESPRQAGWEARYMAARTALTEAVSEARGQEEMKWPA